MKRVLEMVSLRFQLAALALLVHAVAGAGCRPAIPPPQGTDPDSAGGRAGRSTGGRSGTASGGRAGGQEIDPTAPDAASDGRPPGVAPTDADRPAPEIGPGPGAGRVDAAQPRDTAVDTSSPPVAIICGNPGQPCCGANACGAGGCCVSGECHAEGQDCGAIPGTCDQGSCERGKGNGNGKGPGKNRVACGAVTQPCCIDDSGPSPAPQCTATGARCLQNQGEVCFACGAEGQSCCWGGGRGAPDTCAAGLVCQPGSGLASCRRP